MDTITIDHGTILPNPGLGIYHGIHPEVFKNAVRAGFRLIETDRSDFRNLREAGAGIQAVLDEGIVKRDDLFISVRMWLRDLNGAVYRNQIDDTLRELGVSYFDMIRIYMPAGYADDAWSAIEEYHKAGIIRSVSVCHFPPERIRHLNSFSSIRPAMNQFETHCYIPGRDRQESWIQKYPSVSIVREIAETHQKPIETVLLRFLLRNEKLVIIEAEHIDLIAGDIGSLYDFELTEEDMEKLRQQRAIWELDHYDLPQQNFPQIPCVSLYYV